MKHSGRVTGQFPARGSILFEPIQETLVPYTPAPAARGGILDAEGRLRAAGTEGGTLGVQLPVVDGWIWRATANFTSQTGEAFFIPTPAFNFVLTDGATMNLGIPVQSLGYAVIDGQRLIIKGPYAERDEAQAAADALIARKAGTEYRVQELVTV